jgi:hypothetical protein
MGSSQRNPLNSALELLVLFRFLKRCHTFLIERPPGVPFQKIQFGNERGGRSVLSRLPELRIARILALLRCLILRYQEICLLGKKFVY